MLRLTKLKYHLECGEYLQARQEAERLIQLGDLVGEELVQAYRGAALAHYHLRNLFAAIKLAEKALAGARQLGNWPLIGKARYDLGEYHLVLGDNLVAQEYLRQFLADLNLYPELTTLRAWAHHKLGLLHRLQRDFSSALASHQLAVQLHQQHEDRAGVIEATRGVVWCYLTLGEPEKAWPHLHRLTTQLAPEGDARTRASLLTDLAYYYQQAGDLASSMDYCAEVMAPGRPGVDEHILATACVIAGENALILDREKEARIFANLAQEYALQAGQPALVDRAVALRRRLCEVNTRPLQVS